MKSIVAFSGLPQTGKTTLARLLANKLQCQFVSFGDFVRQEAIKRGIVNPTRRDLQDLGQHLVKQNLEGFCKEVLKTVNFTAGKQLVIDGVRHKEVLDVIREFSQNQPIKLVYLTASPQSRRERTPSSVNLAAIDSHEVEAEVETRMKALADIVIETDGDEKISFQTLVDWIDRQSTETSNN